MARVIQGSAGLTVEHDPVRGDLYLTAPGAAAPAEPLTLYLGSERGFTYRLSLNVREREPAQILIRNPETGPRRAAATGDGHVEQVVALIRAAARREPPPGYAVEAGGGPAGHRSGVAVVETWRGPRWTARIVADPGDAVGDAAALAEAAGPGVAAAWISPPGAANGEPGGPADGHAANGRSGRVAPARGGRFAVVVEPGAGTGR